MLQKKTIMTALSVSGNLKQYHEIIIVAGS